MLQALLQSCPNPKLLHGSWVLHQELQMMYTQIYTSACLMLGQQGYLYRDILLYLGHMSMMALSTSSGQSSPQRL